MELVKPGRGGLNISWRTDVTSKQEKYIVVYTRNDTGKSVNIETREKFAELRDLYPGAEYRIQVLAVSHGLQSEPHTTHTAVLPNPAHNLSVAAVRDNTVTLRWLPPRNSRFTEYQVLRPSLSPLYCTVQVRYRPLGSVSWSLPRSVPRNLTQFLLADLPPGQPSNTPSL